MPKRFEKSNKPSVTLCTIGCVDEMWTMFKKVTRTIKQEKLPVGYVLVGTAPPWSYLEYETKSRQYTNMNGGAYRHYTKYMITGATQHDGLVWIVSAPNGVDGAMAQAEQSIACTSDMRTGRCCFH